MKPENNEETILFTVPAQLVGTASRADKSQTLKFVTQEFTPAQAAAATFVHSKHGTLAFLAQETVTDEFDTLELPDQPLEENQKSISERMRAVLFLLWRQKESSESFNSYYEKQGEAIINQLKKRLPQKKDL